MAKKEYEYLIGKQFGFLKVKSFQRFKKGKATIMKLECLCVCGKVKFTYMHPVLKGRIISCGCKRGTSKKHGFSKERLYSVYKSMKSRCHIPNDISYKNYGEKGISVCNEWRSDYMKFREWSLENGYNDIDKELSIDRINNNLGYQPDNCRWIKKKDQNKNRSFESLRKTLGKKIIQIDKDTGQVLNEFETISDASHIASCANIVSVLKKKPNRHTAGGYKWEYKNEMEND